MSAGHSYDAEAYWKANLRLIFGSLIVWALVSYGFAILLRPMLAGIPIGGTDLGFWFCPARFHPHVHRSDLPLRVAHEQDR